MKSVPSSWSLLLATDVIFTLSLSCGLLFVDPVDIIMVVCIFVLASEVMRAWHYQFVFVGVFLVNKLTSILGLMESPSSTEVHFLHCLSVC